MVYHLYTLRLISPLLSLSLRLSPRLKLMKPSVDKKFPRLPVASRPCSPVATSTSASPEPVKFSSRKGTVRQPQSSAAWLRMMVNLKNNAMPVPYS